MKIILLYFQDPGGANFLYPVLRKIKSEQNHDFKIKVLCHPLSEGIISDEYLEPNYNFRLKYPVSIEVWQQFLKDNCVNKVVSTLSSNNFDKSNANLIIAAKILNIQTLGFIDHWKGFGRLLNKKSEPEFCPSWLGVIDRFSINELSKINIKSVMRAVGHPVLEMAYTKKIQKKRFERILLVSQPDNRTKNFDSVFFSKYKNTNLLETLENAIGNCLPRSEIYYRPHPKENLKKLSNIAFRIDNSKKPELFENYDVFIGFDSMLLIEANLVGVESISVCFPEVLDIYKDKIPYRYASKVKNINDFENILNGKITSKKLKASLFENSSNRCLSLIKSFCEAD
jgi:hypothetical protein